MDEQSFKKTITASTTRVISAATDITPATYENVRIVSAEVVICYYSPATNIIVENLDFYYYETIVGKTMTFQNPLEP